MVNKRYDPSTDPVFQRPVIEVDEWRERFLPDGTRLPFRYMRGGFAGTDVRFKMLFPEKDSCRKRFHQCLTPASETESEAVGAEAAMALRSGACFVTSSEREDMLWKASAAVAELSRRKAKEIYGPDRFYGYVYGGEGSAYRALACIENASAWDGAAMVLPGPQTILYDAVNKFQLALSEETEGLPQALTILADWVERGVQPR